MSVFRTILGGHAERNCQPRFWKCIIVAEEEKKRERERGGEMERCGEILGHVPWNFCGLCLYKKVLEARLKISEWWVDGDLFFSNSYQLILHTVSQYPQFFKYHLCR